MTSYEKIFTCFLRKIDDIDLAQTITSNPDIANSEMTGWLHSAVAKLGTFDQKQITFHDDTMTVDEDLTDFDIEIYALGMRVEWLEPIIARKVNLVQMFGGKEEKFYAQSNHITAIQTMLADARVEIRRMKQQYDYTHNSYVNEEV